MAIMAIGVDHRSTSLEVLEKLAVTNDELVKLLTELHYREHIDEAVVLSTCMRTEIYVSAERFHGAVADVRDALAMARFVPVEELSNHLNTYYENAAVEHLFSVAAGLDSAVLGEGEVLGQVVSAWDIARGEGVAGPVLGQLFRHAVETGKRVRTTTAISRGVTSIPRAAVAMASARLGELTRKRFVVVGAGEMGAGLAYALRKAARVADVVVMNRTAERAEAIAADVKGRAASFDSLASELVQADVLMTSTGASHPLFDTSSVSAAMAQRSGRPLLIVDLAVPRDVDPSVGGLDGVTLLDIEDLKAFTRDGIARRQNEADHARKIVLDEVLRFESLASIRTVAPLVSSLRAKAEQMRAAEVRRYSGRLGELTPEQSQAVESLTKALVAKLLHEPTVRLKEASTTVRGDRTVEAFRDLYGLEL